MANIVLNADFRYTDAAERQILRQVAAQQEILQPFAQAYAFVARQTRAFVAFVADVNALVQDVEQRHPGIRGQYL